MAMSFKRAVGNGWLPLRYVYIHCYSKVHCMMILRAPSTYGMKPLGHPPDQLAALCVSRQGSPTSRPVQRTSTTFTATTAPLKLAAAREKCSVDCKMVAPLAIWLHTISAPPRAGVSQRLVPHTKKKKKKKKKKGRDPCPMRAFAQRGEDKQPWVGTAKLHLLPAAGPIAQTASRLRQPTYCSMHPGMARPGTPTQLSTTHNNSPPLSTAPFLWARA